MNPLVMALEGWVGVSLGVSLGAALINLKGRFESLIGKIALKGFG
jgi:hypothetical protein